MKLNTSQKIMAYYLGLLAIGTILLLDSQKEISGTKQKPNSSSLEGQVSMTGVSWCKRDATKTLAENYNFNGNYCLYLENK